MPKLRGKSVNRSEIARICGVAMTTVDAWVTRGCPYLESPREGARGWLFDTAEVLDWREKLAAQNAVGRTEELDIDEARRRKTAAEAALAEYELAEKRGEVVLVEDAAKIAGEGFSRCRARLTALPGRLAPMLAVADTPEECKDLLEGGIHEALAELAAGGDGGELGDDPDRPGGDGPDAGGDAPGDEPDAEAAAEAEGERLGRRKARAQQRVKSRSRSVEYE